MYDDRIIIDVGNTNVKFGVYIASKLRSCFSINIEDIDRERVYNTVFLPIFGTDIRRIKEIKAFVYSVNDQLDLLNILRDYCGSYNVIETEDILDIYSKVQGQVDFPIELGVDRAVKCIYVYSQIQSEYTVIIDLGTATVVEFFVNQRWVGGTIAAGIRSQIKALKDSCNKLHEIDIEKTLNVKSTKLSDIFFTCEGEIYGGTVCSLLLAVNGMVWHVKNRAKINGKTTLLITGGNYRYLPTDNEEICKIFFAVDDVKIVKDLNLTAEFMISKMFD